MTLSSKWTAISFFTLTSALGVGAFAFAGCTVTSGTLDDDGGAITIPPDDDSGSTTDSGTPDATPEDAGTVCEGNTQSSGDFVNAACQAALNVDCCAELKGCFNLVIDPDAGGGPTDDCNEYVLCIDDANSKPTAQEQEDAAALCDLASPQNVIDAYNAIVTCSQDTAHPNSVAACQ